MPEASVSHGDRARPAEPPIVERRLQDGLQTICDLRHHSDRHSRKEVRVTAACIVAFGVALSVAKAASLKREAAKAWDDCVESASGVVLDRANAPAGFLQIGATPSSSFARRQSRFKPIRSSVHIPLATLGAHFQGGDAEKVLAEVDKPANVMIDDLLWWTAALKTTREG